jgi:hypothetical protein
MLAQHIFRERLVSAAQWHTLSDMRRNARRGRVTLSRRGLLLEAALRGIALYSVREASVARVDTPSPQRRSAGLSSRRRAFPAGIRTSCAAARVRAACSNRYWGLARLASPAGHWPPCFSLLRSAPLAPCVGPALASFPCGCAPRGFGSRQTLRSEARMLAGRCLERYSGRGVGYRRGFAFGALA